MDWTHTITHPQERSASPAPGIPRTFLRMVSYLIPLLASFAFLVSTKSAGHIDFEQDKSSGRPLNILPLPTHYTTGNKVICLSPEFAISFNGGNVPEDLRKAAKRVESGIWNHEHQYLSVKRGSEFFGESQGCEYTLSMLKIIVDQEDNGGMASIMDSAIRPAEDRPDLEAYTLSIPLGERATIKSQTALGAFRGLTTFENIFYYIPTDAEGQGGGSKSGVLAKPDLLGEFQQLPLGSGSQRDQNSDTPGSGSRSEVKGKWYAPAAPYEIEDRPAFGWRAVMLDTSRNWFGKEAILKMLDTMAMAKLNVFHWHITDSNSWPLDLASHPELAKYGAYSFAQKYTESDIRQIIAHAGERGIDVVIEIDTPGHTASIAESHPDLIACFEKPPWETYSNQPPPGQLRFASEAATEFTKDIFESTLDLVQSQYFGTGGDEINKKCMLEDEETIASLREKGWTLDDALNEFTAKTHHPILGRSKTPLVWQEMVLEHGEMSGLSKETVVDVWLNSDDAVRVLEKGYRIIHAAVEYFYLDCGHGTWIGTNGGGPSWCDPFKSWQRIYSFDPFRNVREDQKKRVLGGQVSLFAEQTDETNFESVMWPRAAALAEVFWSGAGEAGYPRSSVEAFPRMHDIRYRMVDRGVRAEPLQPHWCALRPGICVGNKTPGAP